MKLATFVWSVNVEVPDDFDQEDGEQVDKARFAAWDLIHKNDGDLTDVQEE